MGIAIGERRLIKDQRRRQREIAGNCVTRTHVHGRAHARTTSGIRDSLPLCVMVSEADMAEWLS